MQQHNMTSKLVYRILLTGGPHGGKTTMLGILQKLLQTANVQAVVVPEAATQVIDMVNESSVPDWLTFQRAIANIQLTHEHVAEDLVEHLGTATTTVMLFDRCIADGEVFTPPGHWQAVLGDTAIENFRPTGLPPFDVVIHLETCAVDAQKYSSRYRLHDAAGAMRVDKELCKMYGTHPKFLLVPYTDNFDTKIKTVCDFLSNVLGFSVSPACCSSPCS